MVDLEDFEGVWLTEGTPGVGLLSVWRWLRRCLWVSSGGPYSVARTVWDGVAGCFYWISIIWRRRIVALTFGNGGHRVQGAGGLDQAASEIPV